MYNTTYKVPSQKRDWPMVGVFLVSMVLMFSAFTKAVDGNGPKAPAKVHVVKHSKG